MRTFVEVRRGTRRRVSASALAVGLAAALTACGSSGGGSAGGGGGNGSDVPIGSVFSVTGSFSAYGQPGAGAVKMAVDEINKTGFKVKGKTYHFKLTSDDTKSDIPTGVAEVRNMTLTQKPVAIFGPIVSPIAAPSAPFSSAHKIIQITPSTDLSTKLPTQGNSTYRYVIGTQNPPGGAGNIAVLKALVDQYHIKTAALLNPNDAAGVPSDKFQREQLKKDGVNIVYHALFPATTTDFTAYVRQVTAAHPDALFFEYTSSWMVPILTLARQQNSAKYFVGTPILQPALSSGPTVATNYVMTSPLPTQYAPNAQMQSFINRFEAASGLKVTNDTNFGYVFTEYPYVYALRDAMIKAGTVTDTTKIINALRGSSVTVPNLPIPPITIQKDGQALPPSSLCSLAGGLQNIKCNLFT